MLIRAAVGDDLPRVIAIDDIARHPDGPRKRFLATHLAEHQMLIAEQGEEILGYVVQDCSFFERGFVHLLYVSEHHRRRGVGTALLVASVAACCTIRVFTSTNLSNERMQALLDKLGWVPAGQVDGLDEGDPEVFYYVDSM
ncbi:MAG: N-acetyltransferase family protein [Acidimicrobiia bacterium]